MTDRVKGLYVVLDKDIRDDDIQVLINAILSFKNVIDIKTELSNFSDYIAFSRVKESVFKKIIDVFTNYEELIK